LSMPIVVVSWLDESPPNRSPESSPATPSNLFSHPGSPSDVAIYEYRNHLASKPKFRD
jgi:hypothetical protein